MKRMSWPAEEVQCCKSTPCNSDTQSVQPFPVNVIDLQQCQWKRQKVYVIERTSQIYVVPLILKETSSEILKWQFVTRAQILLSQ